MTSQGHALARDELIRTLTAYSGITTADGAADGTTLIDTNLTDSPVISEDAIPEKTILIMSGDAVQQDKGAASFVNATGTITLQGTGFSAQILAGTIYKILNISSVEIDVATINTKIGTNVDPAGTTTLFAWMANLLASGVSVFDIVNAMLVLTETGATIDLSDMAGGETATVRTYYRIKSGGTSRLKGVPTIFNGVQAEPHKDVELEPNRFGIRVTIQATATVVIDWEVFYGV